MRVLYLAGLLLAGCIVAAVPARAQGPFLFQWGGYGKEPGTFISPTAITQDGAGTVYVLDAVYPYVQAFTLEGVFLRRWPVPDGAQDIAAGPGGVVYLSYPNQIVEFASDGTTIRSWGSPGAGNGQLGAALDGIAVDAGGDVYVCDVENFRIQRFSADGRYLGQWGNQGSADGEFAGRLDVTVDESGDILVADSDNGRVQTFHPDGTFQGSWGCWGATDGCFEPPVRISCGGAGRAFVADGVTCRLLVYDLQGNCLGVMGNGRGRGYGQFSGGPIDLVATAAGRVYTSDPYNVRVQAFGPTDAETPLGNDVIVHPGGGITLTFDRVVDVGVTTIDRPLPVADPPIWFYRSKCEPDLVIGTTAHFLGNVHISMPYWQSCYVSGPVLFQLVDGLWYEIPDTLALDIPAGEKCKIGDCPMQMSATLTSLGTLALFDQKPPYGTVAGQVLADCPTVGTPLQGVTVDAYYLGGRDLIGSAVTDAKGTYAIGPLRVDTYRITVVAPLGYAVSVEDTVTLPYPKPPPCDPKCIPPPKAAEPVPPAPEAAPPTGDKVTADFKASCLAIVPRPKGVGYWKHQFAVGAGGNGKAQIDASSLCANLDVIAAHFNSNAVNAVVIYRPPSWGGCAEKIGVACDLLNLQGAARPIARARQQLLALLLNVASGSIGLTEVISRDGATVSQAITYCDRVIDDPAGKYDRAAGIAEQINEGGTVAVGMIPLTTQQIAYHLGTPPSEAAATESGPNPSSGAVTLRFGVPAPGARVTVEIFGVDGRRVRMLPLGLRPAGAGEVAWSGDDNRGRLLGAGVYLYRIAVGDRVRSGRIVLVR